MTGKLLTIREVAHTLNITEKDVIELAEKGIIPAYKVGGVYLRFKKEQVDAVRSEVVPREALVSIEGTWSDKARDFIYHNDFYILSLVVIFSLLFFIVKL
jgi:excisionase family DNA binding protein